jgi:hypothetical protein
LKPWTLEGSRRAFAIQISDTQEGAGKELEERRVAEKGKGELLRGLSLWAIVP